MWNERSEIINNANLLGVEYKELSPSMVNEIRTKIEAIFCSHSLGRRLFERFVDSSSVRGSDVWRLVDELTDDVAVYVFFEIDDDRESGFLFKSGKSFTKVHGECADFTVYLTNMDFDYVIASTDEDTLVVVGSLADAPIFD